jgi:hypothetical protein
MCVQNFDGELLKKKGDLKCGGHGKIGLRRILRIWIVRRRSS